MDVSVQEYKQAEMEKFDKISEALHNIIANSETDSVTMLLAFIQTWTSCNIQMELADYGDINIEQFAKQTKKELKQCRNFVLEKLPHTIEVIKQHQARQTSH